MMLMEDRITLMNNNNQEKDYKLLAIIDKEYKYLIYTNLSNTNMKKNFK